MQPSTPGCDDLKWARDSPLSEAEMKLEPSPHSGIETRTPPETIFEEVGIFGATKHDENEHYDSTSNPSHNDVNIHNTRSD